MLGAKSEVAKTWLGKWTICSHTAFTKPLHKWKQKLTRPRIQTLSAKKKKKKKKIKKKKKPNRLEVFLVWDHSRIYKSTEFSFNIPCSFSHFSAENEIIHYSLI
jgi:hypothetical protein